MKLLRSFRSITEAQLVAENLQRSGIAIIFGNENANRVMWRPKVEVDLWVALDHQLEDALQLLEDPNHIVRYPVDVSHFNTELEAHRKRVWLTPKVINQALNITAIAIFTGFIAFAIWAYLSN